MELLRRFAGAVCAGSLIVISCGAPEPIELDARRPYCSWQSSGGDPGRSSFINRPTPDQPRLLWSVELGSSFYLQPTAALGFILVPGIDKKVRIISTNNGSSVAEIKFRDMIVAPLVLEDSMIAINLEGDKLIVGNWVSRMLEWQAELEGSSLEPVIFNDMIYWMDGGDYLRCFDLKEGKRVWDAELSGRYAAPPTCSPRGLVILASDGEIDCFDPENGTKIWQLDRPGKFKNPPVIFDDHILIATTRGRIEKIGIADGRRIWQCDLRSPVYAPLATDGQAVFVGTNNRLAIRIDFLTGRIVWKKNLDGPIKAGPVLTGNLAIYVSIDHNAYFLDKVSGETRHVFETGGMLTSRPIVCDDKVYIASEDSHVYCFQLSKDE